jgi:hypothetical protein
LIVILALALTLSGGCKSAEPSGSAAKKGSKPARPEAKATVVAEPERPSVRPVDAVTGRVIAVRKELRFVIVDFPTRKMPKLDQLLSVYRLDQKVAEIKVSGPYLGTTVAADITAGDVMEGDSVREP